MRLYTKIRLLQYSLALSIVAIFYFISSKIDKIDYEVKQRNIKADKEYLNWLLKSDDSNLAQNIKNILNSDEKIIYIANESQVPFSINIHQEDIDQQVNYLTKKFLKKYQINLGKEDLDKFKEIIRKVIQPEFIFLLSSNEKLDKLLIDLSKILTPVGTTLQDWVIRFLTSDSLLIAIPMIEKIEINNKRFKDLDNIEKEKLLIKISELINKQFVDNLKAIQKKFDFDIDLKVFDVIESRMLKFLKSKFIL